MVDEILEHLYIKLNEAIKNNDIEKQKEIQDQIDNLYENL